MEICVGDNRNINYKKIINLGDNKAIYNNCNELIEREYYSKYMKNPAKSLSIFEREILDNYSNILYKNVLHKNLL